MSVQFRIPQHFRLVMGTISPAPDSTTHDILFFSGELEPKAFSFAITEEAAQGYIQNGQLPFGIALQAMRAGYRVRLEGWPKLKHLYYSPTTQSIREDDGLIISRWYVNQEEMLTDRWTVVDVALLGGSDDEN